MRFLLPAVAAVVLGQPACAATVSLIATGDITDSSLAQYAGVEKGDHFRLLVTFTDGAPDFMSLPYTGAYYPVDLVMTLEIVGKGGVFAGMGGTVVPGMMADLNSGLPSYPGVIISSVSADGYALTLRFADRDGFRFQAERLPFADVHIGDYEAIDFSLVASFRPEQGSLAGTAAALQIPEAGLGSMVLVGWGLVWIARRRLPGQ